MGEVMGVPGRRAVPRSEYRSYIQSEAWRRTRERYWASNLPQDCYCCGAPRRVGFHLHHRTYKNLGKERLMDLVPVCPGCHKEIHALHRSDPLWQRRGLWAVTRRVRKMRGTPAAPLRSR